MPKTKSLCLTLLFLPLCGCGFFSLPQTRSQAKAQLQELLEEYRLRADTAGQMVAAGQSEQSVKTQVSAVSNSLSQLSSIKIDVEKIDFMAFNRFQSYQLFLEQAVATLVYWANNDNTKNKNAAQILNLAERFVVYTDRIVERRQSYTDISRTHNSMLAQAPYKIYNQLYSFQPLLNFDAAQKGP